jgi:hypothetical protein
VEVGQGAENLGQTGPQTVDLLAGQLVEVLGIDLAGSAPNVLGDDLGPVELGDTVNALKSPLSKARTIDRWHSIPTRLHPVPAAHLR